MAPQLAESPRPLHGMRAWTARMASAAAEAWRQPAMRWALLAIVIGLALRVLWVALYQDFDGDSEVYATIAKNMLVHHQYALDDPYHLTLIRVPGYPLFMAGVFLIAGMKNYAAVCWAQVLLDMGTCLLVWGFVRDHVSRRAGLVALWIACLCPFTINYAAVPLTETPAIFCIALGLFACGRLIGAINSGTGHKNAWLLLTAAALIGSVELRPDGVLLAAVVVPAIWWYTRKRAGRMGMRMAAACALLVALPIAAWTVRNWRVYRVFQPLAPRSAMDPTETSLEGFNHWTTTWEADYVSLGEIWWRGDSLPIDMNLLPSRAIDTPEEYQQTKKLIDDYNDLCTIPPEIDARFEALAEHRIHRHPMRQYVVLPLVRLADMWLRPRIEYLNDAVPQRWWEWRAHPGPSLLAAGLGLLNLVLLGAAAVGFARRRVPFAAMMLVYIALRCAVLLQMPNAEPRYTLEAFPMLFVGAAVAVGSRRAVRSS